jgi:metallo-beta-lactamase family protein
MDVRVKFLGANRTVTGSRHLLEVGNYRIMIDCGLFQGLKMLRLRNWDDFPVEPASINAIIITHAHIDHSGYLPKLVKEGFNGSIYCTPSTAILMELLLRDSAKLQVEEADFAKRKGYSVHADPKPLYDESDVEAVLPLLKIVDFDEETVVEEFLSFKYYRAGHILGAAIVEVVIKGKEQRKTIVFSGDLGRYEDPLHPVPKTIRSADILFVESTYANRQPVDYDITENMAAKLRTALKRGGVVLVPAFAVGRTQEILYFLKKIFTSGRMIPCPVYVDSPMAITATSIYRKYLADDFPGNHSFEGLFEFTDLHFCTSQTQSRGLNDIRSNAIIISASGMGTGGRILHHMYNRLRNEQDTILFMGYQAEGTRGRRILDGEPEIAIFGETVPVKCQVDQVKGFSAHANRDELHRWLDGFTSAPKMTYIVHGEMEAAVALKDYLKKEKGWNAVAPEYLESAKLFSGI